MALMSRKKDQPAASQFVAPEDPDVLITWLEKKREIGKERIPELQMKLNLAYVMGQQWVVWDSSRSMLRRPPQQRRNDPNAPVRITANKIGGIVERFIARLTKAAPEAETRPVTDDDKSVDAAKAGTRILQSEYQRLQWESWLVRHYFWPTTHGFAYAELIWDPQAGDKLGEVGSEPVYLGNIRLESVPGHELVVDPNAKDMRSAKWVIRTKAMTEEAIWEQWGVVPVGGESARTMSDEMYELIDQNYQRGKTDTSDRAVHQFWMVPCRAAPKGLVVTWCGKTVLEEAKPFPYSHGRVPYVESDLLPGMGRREGRTWVDDLIALQADYNDARSREAANRRTVTPKLTAQAGSFDPERLSTRADVLLYNPVGERPMWDIPDSGWLSQYESAMNRADMEMGDRAGQSDVSSGKPSSASMPAAAILALQEADDTKLAITYKLMADFIEEVSWHILELVRQFWTEQRLVSTWSEEGALEVKHFTGADVKHQLDVHVSSESAVVRSKSAMVQLALDLWKAGIITDPRHLLRLIKVPGTDFLAEAWNVDTRQAQRENEYLMQGQQVEVNTFDNHLVHITEHDNERKGEEYAKIAQAAAMGDQAATQIKATIDAHVDQHYGLVLQQMGSPVSGGANAARSDHPHAQQAGGMPGAGEYLDPTTGMPPNPTMVAAGQTPSALAGSTVGKRAGIGGAGQPGAVPGVSADQQAASMGQ